MKILKIIREGEQVPFWYGLVGARLDYLNGYEIAPIPINYLIKFWHWTIQSTQLPKWQKVFIDREAEVRNKAFEHGVSVGLKQARHQPEMRELYKKIAKEGMKNGLDVFQYRHLSDEELRKKIDEIAEGIARSVA